MQPRNPGLDTGWRQCPRLPRPRSRCCGQGSGGRREAQTPQDAPTLDLRHSRLGSLGIPGRGRRQCPSPGCTRGGRTEARVRVSEGGEVPSQDPQGADGNDGVRRPCSSPPWSGGLEGQDHSEALGQNSGTSRGRNHSECSLTGMRSKEQGKQKGGERDVAEGPVVGLDCERASVLHGDPRTTALSQSLPSGLWAGKLTPLWTQQPRSLLGSRGAGAPHTFLCIR